jgi:hypothetical protein
VGVDETLSYHLDAHHDAFRPAPEHHHGHRAYRWLDLERHHERHAYRWPGLSQRPYARA